MTIGNGSIPLRIGNLIDTKVYGGPYRDFASWEHIPGMFGVKMAIEIDAPCHVDVPTKDYDVPDATVLQAGITRALMAMINGQPVYVGCWGGIGRTGLFLAALAKVQSEFRISKHRRGGAEDPVLYVRNHFIPHALETTEQMAYIERFDVSDIVRWLDATQIAMGLNIGYQKKEIPFIIEQPVDSPTGRVLKDPALQSIKLESSNEALNNFKADWKERYRGATLQAENVEVRTLDWMDHLLADSKDTGFTEDAQWLQAESLQQQIDELSTQADEMEDTMTIQRKINESVDTRLTNTFKALESLGMACKVGFEEALTNQTYFGKIRDLFK